MSLVQSVFGQLAGALVQSVLAISSRDPRAVIIERCAKVLSLAKEMKAAGLLRRSCDVGFAKCCERCRQVVDL